ncbi:hypothetical protein C2845_PM09G04050 [Panicum miliaceum]|uniref:KIB1-4 beta-propeller domain-containing protein n=1 Tax=Panicum miliaceum TaxID=4540 RepID=A0A3L6S1Q6_PANMI|nr:hypothetical protein C2845_PM09G04050 [Panicum miliaceum]
MDTTPSSRGGVRAPYLALKHVAGSDHPVFFSVSEKKAIDTDVTGELENNNSWATPQGWVLVRNAAASRTYLLDPHGRRTRIQLPHLPEDGLPPVCTCLLSDHPDPADPGRGNCLVLLIEPDNPIIRYCHIGGGGGEWVKYEYDIGTLDLPDLGEGCKEKLVICSIAACGGRFYFNGGFDELGVLEFSPAPAFRSVAIRDAIEQPFGCQKVYLVESGRELFMVSLLSPSDPSVVRRVLVHRMDFARQEWREAGDIGGRAFLVSPWYFGASRPAAECGLEADCVYAAFAGTKRLLVFNVKDGTMRIEAPASKLALRMLPTYP